MESRGEKASLSHTINLCKLVKKNRARVRVLFDFIGCASSPAVSSAPKRAKGSVHHQLQLSFPSEELRDSFLTRLEHAKKLFFSRKSVDNAQFMNALLAKLDRL